MHQEDVDFEKIADLITQDIGMSAKILKLASSPIYGGGRTFSSVREALMTIGFEEFQVYFRTATLHDFLNKSCFPYQGFTDHSQRVALYCKIIAGEFLPKHSNDAYTLGLFHDVGAVLIPLHTQSYAEHIHRLLSLHFGITKMEINVVQTNHCAVGELFAKSWGIAPEILTAMRYHHQTHLDPTWSQNAVNLINILQLAELINDSVETHGSTTHFTIQENENVARITNFFNLSQADFEGLQARIYEFMNEETLAGA